MSVYAVSDLHVQDREDPVFRSLLKLMEKTAGGDTLVLAGDLFDLFVGDKRVFRERFAEFYAALSACAERGVRLHYIEGNHDFLLKRAFASVAELRVHPREVTVEDGGKRFYFAHGDLVDRSDYGYLALRTFFRSPVMRVLVAGVPGEWLDRFGRASSKYSRGSKPAVPVALPLDRRERLRCTYRSFAAEKLAQGYDFVVLGHCHDLDEMEFQIASRRGQYINIGFPRAHGSYVAWHPGEEKIHREPLF